MRTEKEFQGPSKEHSSLINRAERARLREDEGSIHFWKRKSLFGFLPPKMDHS